MADFKSIDEAIKSIGGFKMGPFELMDFIGNDVNYAVTASVFKAFYYDPWIIVKRFKNGSCYCIVHIISYKIH